MSDMEELESTLPDEPLDTKSAPANRAEEGPFDADEANPARPYVDLGGLKILPREGLHLRLEVEEGTNRVVAVGLDFAGSTLQVQAFAAPRSTGLWHEIRAQIEDQILKQGGTSTLREGTFGPELVGEVPVAAGADAAQAGSRLARFVGVDGPRWFLRGVIAELGFKKKLVPYEQAKRRAGKTHNNVLTLYDAAMQSFTTYTKAPVRFFVGLGAFLLGASCLGALACLILHLVGVHMHDQLWLLPTIGIFGSLNILATSVVGEYLLTLRAKMNKRPLVVEERRINFEKKDR
jgi:hypothetical protein